MVQEMPDTIGHRRVGLDQRCETVPLEDEGSASTVWRTLWTIQSDWRADEGQNTGHLRPETHRTTPWPIRFLGQSRPYRCGGRVHRRLRQ